MSKTLKDDRLSTQFGMELAKRIKATLGVVIVYPKNMDQIEEKYGKEGGKEILEQVLDRIRDNTRKVDLVTRMDNSCIAVISIDHNIDGPKIMAKKIYDILNGEGYSRMGMPVDVVVSVGGTSGKPRNEDALEKFIDMAKTALKKAKTRDSLSFVYD